MAICVLPAPVAFGQVSLESVRKLLTPHPAPCLSLYLPTHPRVPDNTVDLPAFRHLVEALELAVTGSLPAAEEERLLLPFRRLMENRGFWQHTRAGLAVLAADGAAQVFLLQRPVAPLAMATDRFHTLPLLRTAASADRFNVLAITSRSAHVYEGLASEGIVSRLDPVPLHDAAASSATNGGPAPTGMELVRGEAVDSECFQPHRVQRGMGPSGLGFGGVVHGGMGSKQDDIDADTEIFLRYVDEVVHERVTRHSCLPLVLVALPRLAAVFRGLSKNRLLLTEGIAKDVHLVPPHELAGLVGPLAWDARARRVAREVHAFAEAQPHGLGSGDLSDVGRAAVAGRVATILVEKDRFEPGRFETATGGIETDGGPSGDLSRSGDRAAVRSTDLFGSVAETVLLHGGGVVALERNEMPTESGVAAIYRW